MGVLEVERGGWRRARARDRRRRRVLNSLTEILGVGTSHRRGGASGTQVEIALVQRECHHFHPICTFNCDFPFWVFPIYMVRILNHIKYGTVKSSARSQYIKDSTMCRSKKAKSQKYVQYFRQDCFHGIWSSTKKKYQSLYSNLYGTI